MSWYIAVVIVSVVLILSGHVVSASSLDEPISSSDKQVFDKILEPVAKIYKMLKYSVSLIAAIYLLVAAVQFMASGNDQRIRSDAKNRATFVFIGLGVLWATPYVISYMVT